jgi:hypothetical protein
MSQAPFDYLGAPCLPAMPEIAGWAGLFALLVITLIGFDLLLRVPKRREDRGTRAAMLADGVDPANLRRRRPLTQRLSGAVLIAAVVVLYLVLRPGLGI